MIGWKTKLAVALGALCLPPIVTCWVAAREIGRMEVIAASGSEAALQAALRAGGDLTFYVSVAAFAGSLVLAAVCLRALVDPLAILLSRLEDVAADKPVEPIPYLHQRDAVGRMAQAVEACRQRRERADVIQRKYEETILASEQERRVVMASLAQGLAALSATRGIAKISPSTPPPAPVLVVDNTPKAEEPLRLFTEPPEDLGLRGLLTRLGER